MFKCIICVFTPEAFSIVILLARVDRLWERFYQRNSTVVQKPRNRVLTVQWSFLYIVVKN